MEPAQTSSNPYVSVATKKLRNLKKKYEVWFYGVVYIS